MNEALARTKGTETKNVWTVTSQRTHALVMGTGDPNVDGLRDISADPVTLSEIIGGHLEEMCAFDEYWDLAITFWRDGEGPRTTHPVNGLATLLWHVFVPADYGRDVLCGPVVVTGGVDAEGNIRPVPDDAVEHYLRLTRAASDKLFGLVRC